MLGLGTAPMFGRALLERQDQRCIDLSDDQIGHDFSMRNRMLSMIALRVASSERRMACTLGVL
jgi:hypothetical protein